MKTFLPVIIAALALASCSTAYKSGQTPDDVYYSPQRTPHQRVYDSGNDYVSMDRNASRSSRYNNEEDNYDDYYLRMKVRNRDRWALLDNDLYFNNYVPYAYNPYGISPYLTYSPYAYSYLGNPFSSYYGGFGGIGFYNSYNMMPYSYYGGGYYPYSSYGYTPYGGKIITVNPRGPVYNRPRTFNMNTYNRPETNNTPRGRIYSNNNDTYYDYNQSSRSRNSGSDLRNIFNNNSSNNSYQNNTQSRSYSAPSSPSPSSGSSSSGGNAPVRRF